jgi:hypothetical protein
MNARQRILDSGPQLGLADIALSTLGFLAVACMLLLLVPEGGAARTQDLRIYAGPGHLGHYENCQRLVALLPADITLYADPSAGRLLMRRHQPAASQGGVQYPETTVFTEFRGDFSPFGFVGREIHAAVDGEGSRPCPAAEIRVQIIGESAVLEEHGRMIRLGLVEPASLPFDAAR